MVIIDSVSRQRFRMKQQKLGIEHNLNKRFILDTGSPKIAPPLCSKIKIPRKTSALRLLEGDINWNNLGKKRRLDIFHHHPVTISRSKHSNFWKFQSRGQLYRVLQDHYLAILGDKRDSLKVFCCHNTKLL